MFSYFTTTVDRIKVDGISMPRAGCIFRIKNGVKYLFFNNRRKPHPKEDIFRDGEAVELVEDVTFKMEGDSGAACQTLLKGLKGIIDNPGFHQGASLDDINSPYQRHNKMAVETQIIILATTHRQILLEKNILEVPLVQIKKLLKKLEDGIRLL